MISITNLAWNKYDEEQGLLLLKNNNIKFLEVSLTKEFGDWNNITEKKLINYKNKLFNTYGLKISSLQSLFFNISYNIFDETEKFFEHFKKIITYSAILDCNYIVFGSPKNRKSFNKNLNTCNEIFIETFQKISNLNKNINIGIESNPVYYNCDYLTTFKQVKDIVNKINKKNILCHLDFGCLTLSDEDYIQEYENEKKILKLIHVSVKDLKSIHNDDKIKYFFNNFYDNKKIFSIEIINENIINIEKSINYINRI